MSLVMSRVLYLSRGIPSFVSVVTSSSPVSPSALEVRVELVDASLLESYGEIERLQKKIMHNLQTTLGIQCKVSLLEPKTLERFVGKAHRVVDLRNEKK